MSLGKAPAHQDMYRTSADICDEELADTSLYKLLHRECHRLFPDEAFADLFQDVGRRSVPPRIVATARRDRKSNAKSLISCAHVMAADARGFEAAFASVTTSRCSPRR